MPVVIQMVEHYKRDLEVYAHKQLPRYHMPSSFEDRADSALMLLVRQCPYIHTLVSAHSNINESLTRFQPLTVAVF